jgi:hypothetical protein
MKKKWNDYGESSLTLLAVYCNIDKESPRIPLDLGDYGRCIHLIECLGLNLKQEKELLNKTAEKYPIWKPIVKDWGKWFRKYAEFKSLQETSHAN